LKFWSTNRKLSRKNENPSYTEESVEFRSRRRSPRTKDKLERQQLTRDNTFVLRQLHLLDIELNSKRPQKAPFSRPFYRLLQIEQFRQRSIRFKTTLDLQYHYLN
jgi:hypothetical protein